MNELAPENDVSHSFWELIDLSHWHRPQLMQKLQELSQDQLTGAYTKCMELHTWLKRRLLIDRNVGVFHHDVDDLAMLILEMGRENYLAQFRGLRPLPLLKVECQPLRIDRVLASVYFDRFGIDIMVHAGSSPLADEKNVHPFD